MSNLVTGVSLPADLMAVLKKYGLPENVIAFKVECGGMNDLLTITATFYAREPVALETYTDVQETRTFKILAVE